MAAYSVCPCCGAARDVRGARFDEEFHTIAYAGRVAQLRPSGFQLVRALHSTLPRPSYRDWLSDTLNVKPDHLRRIVARARERLEPIGLRIDCRSGSYLLAVAPIAESVEAPVLERRAV